MRWFNLLLGDIRFQYKYGFYFVYGVFTFMYVFVLLVVPESWRFYVALMMIFSDPTAMGLMFIGSIVHLEKDERTFHSIVVAPVTPLQYLLSKYVSLGLISLFVALVVGVVAGLITHFVIFTLGIVLGAMLFTAIGLMLALNSRTLNRFMVTTVPIMVLLMIPGGMAVFGFTFRGFILHPGVAIVEVIAGGESKWWALFILIGWLILCTFLCHREVKSAFNGGKKVPA
ncbi:MAG: hypothetical protein EA374_00090 [Acholeplasmatales bacterium]|nr:MAG: hypothetical protein EA374_00090 [Acholeplasmatales bacterium]